MLEESKSGSKYKELLEKSIQIIKSRGFEEIKTDLEGYDDPISFSQKSSDQQYQPDITATNSRGKFYFEIAQKINDIAHLVSKWKLLSTVANMKNGGLHILIPYGQNKFTEELVEQYNIKANLIKLN